MNGPARVEVQSLQVESATGPLVEDISFQLRPGRVTALVGPSGSGKTTIIKAIAGLIEEDLDVRGALRMAGTVQPLRLPARHRPGVAVVFQDPLSALNPLLTVGRFLDEVLRANRPDMVETDRSRTINDSLVQVSLPQRAADLLPPQLSGGERQRTLVAAALLVGTKLLLADEPTAALDAVSKRSVLELLAGLARCYEIPVLVATHDLRSIRAIADDAIVLLKGRVDRIIPAGDLPIPALHPSRAAYEAGTYALEAEGVGKRLGEHPVLDGLNFAIEAGSAVGLTGRSGCGKSTLAKCLAGLMRVDKGEVRWRDPNGSRRRMDHPGPAVQMIFQEPQSSFDPRWSLLGSTADAVRFARPELSRSDCVRLALDTLLDAGLEEATVSRRPSEISGGECQRAAIARTLVGGPSVLIADEPVSALDYEWEKRIFDLLLRYQDERGFALLLISHDLLLLSQICSTVAVLGNGAIVEFAQSRDLLDNPRDAITIELVAAARRLYDSPLGRTN